MSGAQRPRIPLGLSHTRLTPAPGLALLAAAVRGKTSFEDNTARVCPEVAAGLGLEPRTY